MHYKGILKMNRNVLDSYALFSDAQIKEDLTRKSFPYAVMMQHINGDFNISTFIRNGNAFGVERIFYYGKRKWDRRGAVGTHNYKQLDHLDGLEEIDGLREKYRFVAVENGVQSAIPLHEFVPAVNDLYIFGEESQGISSEILSMCEACVYIPQYGSVRSLNVGTASGILMHHVSLFFKNKY
jgi:tRNA G18 (ribose-2'-O)-methylase SpoU